MNLIVQYGNDSITIFEIDNGKRYEVVRWLEDEIDEDVNLQHKVDKSVKLAKNNPIKLIQLIHGSVTEWNKKRENRIWENKN